MAGGRGTTTGAVLEAMVLPALHHGKYGCETQVVVGDRLGGGAHKVDVVAERDGLRYLVSLKWQQVSGTAEQKVPFEAMCLAAAIARNPDAYAKAYLVLGGPGWRLRDFFVQGGMNPYLKQADLVQVVELETFVALANDGKL